MSDTPVSRPDALLAWVAGPHGPHRYAVLDATLPEGEWHASGATIRLSPALYARMREILERRGVDPAERERAYAERN